MDCSLPGSSVHRILQARILAWVPISFSRGSSWTRDWTWVSHISGGFFTVWATRKVHNKCDALELSRNHSALYTQCVEKLSSTKPVLGAKKIGDRCSKGWCDWILFGKFSLQLLSGIPLRAPRHERLGWSRALCCSQNPAPGAQGWHAAQPSFPTTSFFYVCCSNKSSSLSTSKWGITLLDAFYSPSSIPFNFSHLPSFPPQPDPPLTS